MARTSNIFFALGVAPVGFLAGIFAAYRLDFHDKPIQIVAGALTALASALFASIGVDALKRTRFSQFLLPAGILCAILGFGEFLHLMFIVG